ncbi:peptidase M4 (plasmid) [Polymorphobacter megasporae]|nr:peptidase M4 [Polymorphobacter megasporae]
MFVYLTTAATLANSAVVAAPIAIKFKGDKLAPIASVMLASARASALTARPDVIIAQELEKEARGRGLRYSFDIKSKGKTFEVGIDTRTIKLLENKPDGPNAD